MASKVISLFAIFMTAAALCSAEAGFAATVIDPSGDLLSTYIGPPGSDLDILQFSVSLRGSSFVVEAVFNGPPGSTVLSEYLIGIDRGGGIEPFPAGFHPGVSFDSVVELVPRKLSGGEVTLFGTKHTTKLPSGSVTVSGNSISATIPVALLPSTGFASPEDYTFLLWSRSNKFPANQPVQYGIADFAPDQGVVSQDSSSSTPQFRRPPTER